MNRGYVDIFDAGPTVECDVKNIRSVRRSKKLRVLVGEPIGGKTHLICNSRFEHYRACYGNIRVDLDKHEAIIPPKMAAAPRCRMATWCGWSTSTETNRTSKPIIKQQPRLPASDRE